MKKLPYLVRDWRINPQSPKIFDFFKCLDQEVSLYGSYQSAKTDTGLHKLYQLHCDVPNLQSLMVRQEKADLVKTVIPKWENEVLPIHPMNKNSKVKVHGGNNPQWYDWPNGGRTWVAGCNNPKDFESYAYDYVYVCQGEEITLDTWEILNGRCNGRAGNWRVNGKRQSQCVLDMNPDRRDHWTEDRIDSGKLKKFKFTFEDNITLFQDGEWTEFGLRTTENLREILTAHRFTRYFLGDPANAEGAVFDQFDYDTMVIDELPEGIETWPVYRAVDFGARHPFVCTWWAKKPGDLLRICIKEYRWSQGVVEDHAGEILRLSRDFNIRSTWADHDLEDALTLRRHGVKSTPAIKSDKLKNIDNVRTLMQKGKILFYKHALVKVDPKLKANNYPKDLISEIERWQWKENTAKDEPVKMHDDSIDTMLYACAGIDQRSGSAHPGTLARRNLV